MNDVERFFGVMMTLLTTGLVGYAGIVAIGGLRRRLNRQDLSGGLNPDEVELVRHQLAETEQLRARVGELEERLDFAERLLEQGRPDRQLDPGAR